MPQELSTLGFTSETTPNPLMLNYPSWGSTGSTLGAWAPISRSCWCQSEALVHPISTLLLPPRSLHGAKWLPMSPSSSGSCSGRSCLGSPCAEISLNVLPFHLPVLERIEEIRRFRLSSRQAVCQTASCLRITRADQ